MKSALRILCAFACCAASALAADGGFYLKDGDRVVFYGDSITDQRLYTVITETYAVTRYPKLHLTFVHSGWGGDRVTGGGGGPIDVRLRRDVLAYKPTVMTIMLGMNDGNYKAETEATDKTFFDGYRHIVDSVRADNPQLRITAIQPSPYDDFTRDPNFPGGYNEVLLSFSKWIANYADEAHLTVADLNRPVVAMLRKAASLDPEAAQKIVPDRVHPGFSGHLSMAEQLLKAWSARSTVSAVTIEAGKSPKVEAVEHATVTNLAHAGTLAWDQTDDALPLPFAQWEKSNIALVLRSSDVTSALNEQMLTVKGLRNGVYTLKIDGQAAATVNNDELARGVNLALLMTPMSEQANDVYQLTVSHCDVHNQRWRTIQVPLEKDNLPETAAAMQSADALEQSILQKRDAAAQPKQHHFEVTTLN